MNHSFSLPLTAWNKESALQKGERCLSEAYLTSYEFDNWSALEIVVSYLYKYMNLFP